MTTLYWRTTWLPVLASSSRPLLLVQSMQGALFTDAEALAVVMATKRKIKPAWRGWSLLTQRSVYPHFCTHLYASSHTHWHEHTHAQAGMQKHMWTMDSAKLTNDHVVILLLIFKAHISKVLHCVRGTLPVFL